MKTEVREVLERAKSLAPIDRVELLEELFGTFDDAPDLSVDAAWAEEAESRLAA